MLPLRCVFVQLQPAVTTGLVSSREQASCNKSGMCLFDGLLEMRVQLGGKQICQWSEWIIAIDAVRRWHEVRSIYQLCVFVSFFGGKAKHVAVAHEPVSEVFPWRWVRAKYKCQIICACFHIASVCTSHGDEQTHMVLVFKAQSQSAVWIHNSTFLSVELQHNRPETRSSNSFI